MTLHVLLLTQVLPYPPDAGPKVKTWNVLKYLVNQGYRVTLASFIREEEREYLSVLQRVCDAVYTVPIQRSHILDGEYWLKSQMTRRPFLIERDRVRAMQNLVAELSQSQNFDIIHSDQISMTQFALSVREQRSAPVLIFDAHNAVWTIVERMKQNAPILLKPILALETNRVKRYEGLLIHNFDYTLAVTEVDKQALLQATSADRRATDSKRISVIPIAVDIRYCKPTKRPIESVNILTLGTLHYPPNADGIRWFAREIFPLVKNEIPDVTLTIIGKDPPKDFLQLALNNPGVITITGYVPDLTTYLERAALMVIPVRAGGGMRVRILEAFARAVPVITTTLGMEGIDALPGKDLLVEDTVTGFAQATIHLLQDPALQSSLAQNGRQLVEKAYDWQVVLKKLNSIYEEIASKKIYAHDTFAQI